VHARFIARTECWRAFPVHWGAGPALLVVFLFGSLPMPLASGTKTYSPKNTDEVEVFAVVLHAEVEANGWTPNDVICVSVDLEDPSKKLVAELRRRNLNICAWSEWKKRLACNFVVDLSPATFESAASAKVRAEVDDFRDINTGAAHIVTRLRSGEYRLAQHQGKWTVSAYNDLK
jgi:hypothetical protein